jgi:hypothetical protein
MYRLGEIQRASLGVSEGVAGRKSDTRLKPSWGRCITPRKRGSKIV